MGNQQTGKTLFSPTDAIKSNISVAKKAEYKTFCLFNEYIFMNNFQ